MKVRIWGDDFDIELVGIERVCDRSHTEYFKASRDKKSKTYEDVKIPSSMIDEWRVVMEDEGKEVTE